MLIHPVEEFFSLLHGPSFMSIGRSVLMIKGIKFIHNPARFEIILLHLCLISQSQNVPKSKRPQNKFSFKRRACLVDCFQKVANTSDSKHTYIQAGLQIILNFSKTHTGWKVPHREQQVILDGVRSESAEVLSGVPKGTVLRPLLFLCFINSLPLVSWVSCGT